ncbi:MAG: hypothetical protein ABW007_27295 [Chitinophagaceae bacterium]
MPAAATASPNQWNSRRKMMAAINIQWKELRPDLHHSPDELREERLAYITDILKLKEPLGSLKDLTNYQMSRVLAHFDGLRAQPALPSTRIVARPAVAEIVHLATAQQVYTINKLLDFLGWHPDSRKKFLTARYQRENPVHLRPRQANALIRILFNIACSQELKKAGFKKVSRAMIGMHIPVLKKKLGIDRKESHTTEDAATCQETLISLADCSAG